MYKARKLILVAVFLLLSAATASAGWGRRPQICLMQTYRYDLRQHNHQLYIDRLASVFVYKDKNNEELFKFEPFFEARRNIHKGFWERKELGAEIGKNIFRWLYIGEGIQGCWMKEDYRYYGDYEKRDYAESETRLLLSHDLFSCKCLKLKGFILNEYAYDFDRGAGTRNEVAIGFIIPIGKYIETGMNWRHIDRIHYYDSDTFEASLNLIF